MIICQNQVGPSDFGSYVDVTEMVPSLVKFTELLAKENRKMLRGCNPEIMRTKVTVVMRTFDEIRRIAVMLMTEPALSLWGGVEFLCKEQIPEGDALTLLKHMQARRSNVTLTLHPPP